MAYASLARYSHGFGSRSHAAIARAVARAKAHQVHPIEEKAISMLGGVALAFAESKMPMSVVGIPTKGFLIGAATAIELKSSGKMRRAAQAVGNAASAVYGYNAFKTKTLIAGS